MTPLPLPLGPSPGGSAAIIGWRLDHRIHAPAWDTGEGAFRVGGRWNGPGVRCVYASLDPATAIMEVTVHKGFAALDTTPHTLTWFTVSDPADIFVVWPEDVPNANWLRPTTPNAGQRTFGETLLKTHPFVLIPSAVSTHSWNLIFDPALAAGRYNLGDQEPFALDPGFNPDPRSAAPIFKPSGSRRRKRQRPAGAIGLHGEAGSDVPDGRQFQQAAEHRAFVGRHVSHHDFQKEVGVA